jgi:hypothetical protein
MSKLDYRLGIATTLLPLVLAAGCAAQSAQGDAKAASAQPSKAAAAHTLPAPSALETQTGIQVAHVGLTAQGGLVDARFKVLDADKARKLLANPANAPVLIAGDTAPLMAPHNALKGARFSKGQIFYILYPNVRGAVKAGEPVTVAMGPVRLGPVKAQ